MIVLEAVELLRREAGMTAFQHDEIVISDFWFSSSFYLFWSFYDYFSPFFTSSVFVFCCFFAENELLLHFYCLDPDNFSSFSSAHFAVFPLVSMIWRVVFRWRRSVRRAHALLIHRPPIMQWQRTERKTTCAPAVLLSNDRQILMRENVNDEHVWDVPSSSSIVSTPHALNVSEPPTSVCQQFFSNWIRTSTTTVIIIINECAIDVLSESDACPPDHC